jgi:hypothetical protein
MRLVDSGCGMTLIPQLTALELDKKKYSSQIFEFNRPVPKREVSLIVKRQFAKKEISKGIEKIICKVLPPELLMDNDRKSVLDPLG